jgi:hypothetical protein
MRGQNNGDFKRGEVYINKGVFKRGEAPLQKLTSPFPFIRGRGNKGDRVI